MAKASRMVVCRSGYRRSFVTHAFTSSNWSRAGATRMAPLRRRVMSSASGSSNMIAATAEASTILTSVSFITHSADNFGGLARRLEAEFPDLCQELVGGQPPWRPHRLIENREHFALHRAVIPLGPRL